MEAGRNFTEIKNSLEPKWKGKHIVQDHTPKVSIILSVGLLIQLRDASCLDAIIFAVIQYITQTVLLV